MKKKSKKPDYTNYHGSEVKSVCYSDDEIDRVAERAKEAMCKIIEDINKHGLSVRNEAAFNLRGDTAYLLEAIRFLQRERIQLQARLEAMAAVKDRFKELYTEAVISKTLEECDG